MLLVSWPFRTAGANAPPLIGQYEQRMKFFRGPFGIQVLFLIGLGIAAYAGFAMNTQTGAFLAGINCGGMLYFVVNLQILIRFERETRAMERANIMLNQIASKMLVTAACPVCKGNDGDQPCAFPGDNVPGCLRDARLKANR